MLPHGAKKIVNSTMQSDISNESTQTVACAHESDQEQKSEMKKPRLSLTQWEVHIEKESPGWHKIFDQAWEEFSRKYSYSESVFARFLPDYFTRNYTFIDAIKFIGVMASPNFDPDAATDERIDTDVAHALETIRAYPSFFPQFANKSDDQIKQQMLSSSEVKNFSKSCFFAMGEFFNSGMSALNEVLKEINAEKN